MIHAVKFKIVIYTIIPLKKLYCILIKTIQGFIFYQNKNKNPLQLICKIASPILKENSKNKFNHKNYLQ